MQLCYFVQILLDFFSKLQKQHTRTTNQKPDRVERKYKYATLFVCLQIGYALQLSCLDLSAPKQDDMGQRKPGILRGHWRLTLLFVTLTASVSSC